MFILYSKFDEGLNTSQDFLKKNLNPKMKISILPWAFSEELDSILLLNDYFKKGNNRYNRYMNILKSLGFMEDNICILNCYRKCR